jgi:hypothetical protein
MSIVLSILGVLVVVHLGIGLLLHFIITRATHGQPTWLEFCGVCNQNRS